MLTQTCTDTCHTQQFFKAWPWSVHVGLGGCPGASRAIDALSCMHESMTWTLYLSAVVAYNLAIQLGLIDWITHHEHSL